MSEYIVKAADWVIDYNGDSAFKDCERIVRCRDCEFFNPRDGECGGRNWCKRMSFEVAPDGFCAWGEKREDGGAKVVD